MTAIHGQFGSEWNLYFCTAGIGDTPTWVLATNVRDLSFKPTRKSVELNTRSGGAATGTCTPDFQVDWSMTYDSSNAAFTAFQTAYNAGSIIGLAVVDGLLTVIGTKGKGFDACIETMEFDPKLDEKTEVKFSAKKGFSSNAPIDVTGTGS